MLLGIGKDDEFEDTSPEVDQSDELGSTHKGYAWLTWCSALHVCPGGIV